MALFIQLDIASIPIFNTTMSTNISTNPIIAVFQAVLGPFSLSLGLLGPFASFAPRKMHKSLPAPYDSKGGSKSHVSSSLRVWIPAQKGFPPVEFNNITGTFISYPPA